MFPVERKTRTEQRSTTSDQLTSSQARTIDGSQHQTHQRSTQTYTETGGRTDIQTACTLSDCDDKGMRHKIQNVRPHWGIWLSPWGESPSPWQIEPQFNLIFSQTKIVDFI